MAELREAPTFNISAVAKETGLKPDTLRAWERRYGLPTPERSSGGHRLYSQHDIDILKWLVARQEEGLSISNAVDLWNQLRQEERDPLAMPKYRDAERSVSESAIVTGETVTELQSEWVQACLVYDERAADQVLNQAFGSYDVETVVLEIVRAGIAEIGERWYSGEAVVQQEHFATEQAMRRLEALLAATPPPTRPDRILVACPPGELHTFSLLIQALLLRRRGWPVIQLGANVPLARFQSALGTAEPSLVTSAAQQIKTAATLQDLGELLREEGVPLGYGGGIFVAQPPLRDRIPGHYLGELIRESPGAVERLISQPGPVPPVDPPPSEYQRTRRVFREKLAGIGQRVRDGFTGVERAGFDLAEINTYMAEGILAALQLGDLAYLDREIGWVEELIVHHLPESSNLPEYLDIYHQSVRSELADEGRLILEWLERMR